MNSLIRYWLSLSLSLLPPSDRVYADGHVAAAEDRLRLDQRGIRGRERGVRRRRYATGAARRAEVAAVADGERGGDGGGRGGRGRLQSH